MSRCCSGPRGINTSRGSTDFCCPGKSRCSSGPCDLYTSPSNSGFFIHTVQSFQQISIIFLTPRGNLGITNKYIRNSVCKYSEFRDISQTKCRGNPQHFAEFLVLHTKIPYSAGSKRATSVDTLCTHIFFNMSSYTGGLSKFLDNEQES